MACFNCQIIQFIFSQQKFIFLFKTAQIFLRAMSQIPQNPNKPPSNLPSYSNRNDPSALPPQQSYQPVSNTPPYLPYQLPQSQPSASLLPPTSSAIPGNYPNNFAPQYTQPATYTQGQPFAPQASKISEQVVGQQAPIKGQSRIEYVPYERTVTEYEEVRRQVQVPVTKQVTDYYAVQYEIEYIPQVIQEKQIEYVPVERVQERTEYYTVEKQNIIQQPPQYEQSYVQPTYVPQQIQYQQQVIVPQPIPQAPQPVVQQAIPQPVIQHTPVVQQPIQYTYIQPQPSFVPATQSQYISKPLPQTQTYALPQQTIGTVQTVAAPQAASIGVQTTKTLQQAQPQSYGYTSQQLPAQNLVTTQYAGQQTLGQTVNPATRSSQQTVVSSQIDQKMAQTKSYKPNNPVQPQQKPKDKSFLERLFD